ncbi:MAG TPA: monovalent cation:proton antiporter-2 (CPA2) family protein [Xanthobacteraceae bacterium]|nr:monovalent cation:proton antiporter-2 (CPA2) family protein [Xanthobacteraceae bacterium]
MNQPYDETGLLLLPLVLLVAAVVSVPIARLLRLSPIVAYLAAGVVIGPYGVALFREPETILTVAQLGVVFLLFLIGLELEISRLLAMRRAIFGLGAAQLALTAAILGGLGLAAGLASWRGVIVAALALAMSASAIALKILEERGDLQQLYGQRAFAILLFQDMSVVPLLALVPLLAPGANTHVSFADAALSVGKIAAAIALVVAAGRYLLNPFLRLLAGTGAREVMTAAALLVVLGAAALMQAAGMSMALGAFLAGMMLAESNYRHELEADIEPFRGLLLALFFMGVGMSIDLTVVRANLGLIAVATVAIAVLKIVAVWAIFLPVCSTHREALRAGAVLTAADEFAFVLIPLGVAAGALSAAQGNLFAAIAAATMLIATPVASLVDTLLLRLGGRDRGATDDFGDVRGSALLIGFGRFGQIVAQCLLAEGVDVTTIDNDPEMIEFATRFGFKVYYGDGGRLDVLRAAGAETARLIAVCVDDPEMAIRIVDIARAEFPGAALYVRSYDRRHSLRLIAKGVDFELRDTFESALVFGRRVLEGLGLDRERAQAIEDFVRARDLERLALQQAEGVSAGLELLQTRLVQPEPLSKPRREAQALNPPAGIDDEQQALS